jgi:ElaB/YqjD/DUF883 family membrane-anchored ribosome-binding protein
MANIKPVEEASRDFAADLAVLRDDVAKLSISVSELIRAQTAAAASTGTGTADEAQQKLSSPASKMQDRVSAASSELETTIERNPLMAVFTAFMAGMLLGLLSRGRK